MLLVAACVDGTHVECRVDGLQEHQYTNRHHRHSINVMVACGPQLQLCALLADLPGAAADQRVYNYSALKVMMDDNATRPFPGTLCSQPTFVKLQMGM